VEEEEEEEEEEDEEDENEETKRSMASSSSSAVFSSLSNGTYSGDEKAFYLSGSDESVASSPSLLSSLFRIERQGREGGGVDVWDEEEGEWEVNEEGEAEDEEDEEEEEGGDDEEEASGEEEGLAEEGEWEVNEQQEEEEEEEKEEEEEEEDSREKDGLTDLTWWEVLGESPPEGSEEGGEGGRTGRKKGRRTTTRSRRRRSSSSSSSGSSRRGAALPRNQMDHLWDIFSPPSPPPPPFSPRPSLSSIASVSSSYAYERGGRRRGGRHFEGVGRRGSSVDKGSQILIKERNPGADVWDVYMGSNGKLRRRPRWSVYGC